MSTLALFKLGVFLVNHVQATLATHNLAIGGALLDRGSCFHNYYLVLLFVSE